MTENKDNLNKKIINFAKVMYGNSEDKKLKGKILSYLIDPNKANTTLHKIFERIVVDGYPMFRFQLFDIPRPWAYTFVSKDEKKDSFNICFQDLDLSKNTIVCFTAGGKMHEAANIAEAIRCYRWEE